LFDKLNFHPLVKKHSERLFKDGHYAPAIFESSKALIRYVRKKSRLTPTNERELISQAFSVNHTNNPLTITKRPVLSVNSLSDILEVNEQEGVFHLFSGMVVGIRNPKAHDTVVQKDPYETLHYLSLISLLAKRTDEAKLQLESSS
jgi:uncharacterized protein (TIGR02391 family)